MFSFSCYHHDCPSTCIVADCDGGYCSDSEVSGASRGSHNCQREYAAITHLASHSCHALAAGRRPLVLDSSTPRLLSRSLRLLVSGNRRNFWQASPGLSIKPSGKSPGSSTTRAPNLTLFYTWRNQSNTWFRNSSIVVRQSGSSTRLEPLLSLHLVPSIVGTSEGVSPGGDGALPPRPL